MSTLETQFERRLRDELAHINTTALDGDKGQTVTWPAKERVAFYAVVAEYLKVKRAAAPTGPAFGSQLARGGGD